MTGVRSTQEKVFSVAAHAVMILLTILAIAPFWLMVSGSLTDNATLTGSGYTFVPRVFSLEAYRYIVQEWAQIGRAYGMTIVVTVAGTVISLMLCSTAAYILSQKDIPGIKAIFALMVFTILFNGGVVSSYVIYSNLFNIKNTIWALLFPNLLLNAFNVTLMKNYVSHSIPGELMEAAEMDGCGILGCYWKIVLPLSKPIMATVGLLTAVAYWNDWTNGLYYVDDSRLYTIQLLLNQMNNNIQYMAAHSELAASTANMPTTSIRMAIAVVGILPIVILYPFFHKYFEAGITMGAVKG